MAFDFDVVEAAKRLEEIRLAKRQLEVEESQIRQKLAELLKAAGGRIVVGGYVLSLTSAETFRYKEIVESLRSRHPELCHEIDSIADEFRTIYERVEVRRL
jgi:uncharacterized membrane protein